METKEIPQWIKEKREKEAKEEAERLKNNLEALKTTELDKIRESGVFRKSNHKILLEVVQDINEIEQEGVLGIDKEVEDILDRYLKVMVGVGDPKYRESRGGRNRWYSRHNCNRKGYGM